MKNRLMDSRSYLWLVLSMGIGFFAYGAWLIPLAVWIAPIFSLRFLRTQPFWRGVILLYLGGTVVFYFQALGSIPIPQPGYTIFVIIGSLIWMSVFVADRLLTPRLPGFLGTLVYPSAVVVLEFANSFGEFGSSGNIAYTQTAILPLLQLASVTGMWGISFLVSWLASLVNWGWEHEWQWTTVQRGVTVVAAILVVVFGYGYWRLLTSTTEQTIRVAAIPSDSLAIANVGQYLNVADDPSPEARATLAESNTRLFARSRLEAQAGAQAVAWAEGNAIVFQDDEPALIEMGQTLAQEEGIYLMMAVAVFRPHEEKPLENKLIFIQPNGQIAWEYWKAFPVPGPELEMSVAGSTALPTTDTTLGRIAGVICFDMDHHYFLQEAGRGGVDLLFAPSNDWEEIMQIHRDQALFRAVENGFTLVRPTSNGISVAADPYGRILAESNDFITNGSALVANVPVQGIVTPYQIIGDSFAWLSIFMLAALTAGAFIRRGRRAVTLEAQPSHG